MSPWGPGSTEWQSVVDLASVWAAQLWGGKAGGAGQGSLHYPAVWGMPVGTVCSFPLVQNQAGKVVGNFTHFVLVERRAHEEDAHTPCSPAQTSYVHLACSLLSTTSKVSFYPPQWFFAAPQDTTTAFLPSVFIVPTRAAQPAASVGTTLCERHVFLLFSFWSRGWTVFPWTLTAFRSGCCALKAFSVSFVRALWPAFPLLSPEPGLTCAEFFLFSFTWAGVSSVLVVLHSHVEASLLMCAFLWGDTNLSVCLLVCSA